MSESTGARRAIKNSTIGDYCEISPDSVVEDAQPRMRPAPSVHSPVCAPAPNWSWQAPTLGASCETKKARLGKGSKAGHLTYLGDAEIGDNVNIGAGTITCNYDGANKHKTIIGDDVFVVSDTSLGGPGHGS